MKIKTLLFSLFTACAPLTAAPVVHAQDLSIRTEAGVAVPVTDPQANRFNVGGALALKPEIGLGSYVGVGPGFQVASFSNSRFGIDSGTAWSVGPFLRIKRPHDEKNKDSGFAAVSPWVDGDIKYVRTGDLDRFGAAVAVGASVPTSDKKNFWVGPFVRYDLVNQADGKAGFNTNSAKTLIFGISFECSPPVKYTKTDYPKKEEAKEQVKNPPPPVTEEKKPEPKKPDVEISRISAVIQFPWDSSEIKSTEKVAMNQVLAAMLKDKDLRVRIEGHASSEGQVEHNNKLSLQRAESVMNWLAKNGVSKDRMTAVGFGSNQPVADNRTEAGRIKNRRATFDVSFVMEKNK